MAGNDGLKQIAIFASGSGTNAENIVRYFNKGNLARVAVILTNNKNAFVIDRAAQMNVACKVFNREMLYKTNEIPELLKSMNIDLIVLAGFLWLVPDNLLKVFPGKVVNIHPALLPKYGGKGMYGHVVHDAVLKSGDRESGITIHYINEKYDEGEIILQARCEVNPAWSADELAEKIHELEYFHYPRVIEKILLNTDK
jgi:phosphoribosylglycinamide formyltransferase-1